MLFPFFQLLAASIDTQELLAHKKDTREIDFSIASLYNKIMDTRKR